MTNCQPVGNRVTVGPMESDCEHEATVTIRTWRKIVDGGGDPEVNHVCEACATVLLEDARARDRKWSWYLLDAAGHARAEISGDPPPVTLKRFHVFVHHEFDAAGGLNDYGGAFATLDEARAAADGGWQHSPHGPARHYDSAEIALMADDGTLGQVAWRDGWMDGGLSPWRDGPLHSPLAQIAETNG